MMERPRARRRSRSNGSIYIPLLANISADHVASVQAAGVTVHIRLGDSPEEYAAMLSTGAPVWGVQDVADARAWLRSSRLLGRAGADPLRLSRMALDRGFRQSD
jgi:hypothetical protein